MTGTMPSESGTDPRALGAGAAPLESKRTVSPSSLLATLILLATSGRCEDLSFFSFFGTLTAIIAVWDEVSRVMSIASSSKLRSSFSWMVSDFLHLVLTREGNNCDT